LIVIVWLAATRPENVARPEVTVVPVVRELAGTVGTPTSTRTSASATGRSVTAS